VALTERNTALLVKQYCYAAGSWVYQIPKGFVDDGEMSVDAAKRELTEELGVHHNAIVHLLDMHADPGLIAGRMEVFLATGCSATRKASLEDSEVIDGSLEVDLTRLTEDLARFSICDAVTIAALYLVRARLALPS
jgi:8-oxo-dGTP pyrophosphatase MutT (NUDIX family)